MLDRRSLVVVVALVAALAAAGPAVAGDPVTEGTGLSAEQPTDPASASLQAVNVTTDAPIQFNATGYGFLGSYEGIAEGRVVGAWFEYRSPTSGEVDWTRTRPANVWSGGFGVNVTGLSPGTTYEVRAVLETPNGTVRGSPVTFETAAVDGTPTEWPDATGHPTGTATPTPPTTGSITDTPVETVPPSPTPTPIDSALPTPTRTSDIDLTSESPAVEGDDSGDWLSGLVPLLVWVGVATVLAPLLLATLLWVRSVGDR